MSKMNPPSSRSEGTGARDKSSGEFERIAKYFAPLARGVPGALGLVDDAARLQVPEGEELIVTTDTIVESVHFIGNEDPARIASKLLRVSLSDLIAKGACPLAYTLNLALPGGTPDAWLARFVAGLRADQDLYQLSLIGGDTVRSISGFILTATLFGTAPIGRALSRLGAQAGDEIFVSGTIGDAALGLRVVQGEWPELEQEQRLALIDAYEVPDPPQALIPLLLEFASASMDISDGLLADLTHLCTASKVDASIDLAKLPISAGVRSLVDQDTSLLITCATGGDDYQTLCTVPPHKSGEFVTSSRSAGVLMSKIGEVTGAGQGGLDILDITGNHIALDVKGYVHH